MGLRVLLQTQKAMKEKERKLVIKNMGESIREVFEMTGFINLMVQEEKFIVIRKDEGGLIRLSLLGEMDTGNVPLLSQELDLIRESGEAREASVTVALDAEKLSSLSTAACRALQKVIADSAWSGRKLCIQNAPPPVRETLLAGGLGELLEEKP
jgi:anti-anti-sigma regulatory factor